MESRSQIVVSVVIVCMNNLKNLFPCLDSVRDCASTIYEVYVVAYLFSEENMNSLREGYPWVKIIESNEVRGFSENNNLALRKAKGEFCFILNDDTYFDAPIIDGLVDAFRSLPDDVAVVSPNIKYPDGRVQYCGRPKLTMKTYLYSRFKLWREKRIVSEYTNKDGLFQSYNILGAAFMIKRDVFSSIGYFDEIFFFSPEDIAVSTRLNRSGYKCYVDSRLELFHEGGNTERVSKISLAIKPAGVKGNIAFYSDGSFFRHALIVFAVAVELLLKTFIIAIKYIFKNQGKKQIKIKLLANYNTIYGLFSRKTPKELFVHFSNKYL